MTNVTHANADAVTVIRLRDRNNVLVLSDKGVNTLQLKHVVSAEKITFMKHWDKDNTAVRAAPNALMRVIPNANMTPMNTQYDTDEYQI